MHEAEATWHVRCNEMRIEGTVGDMRVRRSALMPTADRLNQMQPGVFEALHHIGVAIGGVLEPIGLARLVAEQARVLLATDAAGLWVFDEPSDSLTALHLEGGARPSPAARPDKGIVGRAFTERVPVVVLDYPNWEHAVQSASRYGDPQAMVAVPLLVGGRAVGVLGIGFSDPRQATPAAVETLILLAAQVAPALEAARLYEAARAELADRRRSDEALRF
jgi:GAF domain-containing protein